MQLRELLHLIPAEPKDGLPGVVASLLRGRPLEADAVLDTLARTLRVPTIYVRPETLFHQCHDDLEWPYGDENIPVCRPVAEELHRRMRQPWLRYWNRGPRPPEMILRGHDEPVKCVTALRNGQLASAGWDGTVRVWDLAGGEPRMLEGHRDWIRSVAALGGGLLASAGEDGMVRVWDLDGGQPFVLEGHLGEVQSVTARGGGRIASAGDDGTVRVWDIEQGKTVMMIEADAAVTSICGLTNPLRIVMGLANGRLLLVDVVEPPP